MIRNALAAAAAVLTLSVCATGPATAQIKKFTYCVTFRADIQGQNPAVYFSEVFHDDGGDWTPSSFQSHVSARHDDRPGGIGASCARNFASSQAAEDSLNRKATELRGEGRKVVFTRWRP